MGPMKRNFANSAFLIICISVRLSSCIDGITETDESTTEATTNSFKGISNQTLPSEKELRERMMFATKWSFPNQTLLSEKGLRERMMFATKWSFPNQTSPSEKELRERMMFATKWNSNQTEISSDVITSRREMATIRGDHCFPECLNGGVCSVLCFDPVTLITTRSIDRCSATLLGYCKCKKGFEGKSCETDSCLARPIAIPTMNFTFGKNDKHSGHIECAEGYTPSSAKRVDVTCVDGVWTPSANEILMSDFSCDPVCQEPPLNKGICLAPDFYNCPYPFGGKSCRKRVDQECDQLSVDIVNGELVEDQENDQTEDKKPKVQRMTLKCLEGFEINYDGFKDDVPILCLDGNWTLPDDTILNSFDNYSEICKPVCHPPCENGGTCTDSNMCLCEEGFEGATCSQMLCTEDLPTINNAIFDEDSQPPTVKCSRGYQLSNGLETTNLKCTKEGWSFEEFEPDSEVACLKILDCPGIPPPVLNAKIEDVSVGIKKAICNKGYKFPSGKDTARISCLNGQWKVAGNYSLHGGCTPSCKEDCLNGGYCVGPNLCSCPPNTKGDRCEVKKCEVNPFYGKLRSILQNGVLEVDCGDDVFANGERILNITCKDGSHHLPFPYPDDTLLKCYPKCHRKCQNGGTCQPSGQCSCPRGTAGEFCGEIVTCDRKKIPYLENSKISKIHDHSFEVTCLPGYKLPGDKDSISGECVNGNWTLVGYTVTELDMECEPHCEGHCSGRGVCESPGKCKCSSGFTGSSCQYKLEPGCYDPPPKVSNAVMFYNLTDGNYSCFAGHSMAHGMKTHVLKCRHGKWDITNCDCNDVSPSCNPECNPGCLNGGKCVAPNVCECQEKYTGKRCQTLKPRECHSTVMPVPNSNVLISLNSSTIGCRSGYRFSNGRTNESIWCDDGEWKFGSHGTEVHTKACFPYCKSSCMNNGVCIAPNSCQCIEPFTGSRCQTLRSDLCWDQPISIKNAVSHYSPFTATIRCLPGYSFAKNTTSIQFRCHQGKWNMATSFSQEVTSCLPVCASGCLNGAACTAPDTCSCLPGFEGPRCERTTEVKCDDLPTPLRYSTIVISKERARLSCFSGYKLNMSSGYSEVEIECHKGSWVVSVASTVTVESLRCEPMCEKPCQHQGTCIKPNTCDCKPSFTGRWCEHKKCSAKPKVIENSFVVYSDDRLSGISRCISGYRLRWGSLGVRFMCENGNWKYLVSETQWLDLACHPMCRDPCVNGGKCIAPNVCRCPEGFFGTQCQKRYSKTITGKECQFPFRYQDEWYYGCTGKNYHRPWCAVSTNAQNLITSWAVCVADLGRKKVVITYTGDACVFPFKYRGQDYTSCTTRDRGRPWCATEINTYEQIVAWGFCNPNWGSQTLILTVHGEMCKLPFYLNGQRHVGCVENSLRPWCVTAQSNSVATKHGYCMTDWGYHRVTMTKGGNICIFPFVHESHTYDSCFAATSEEPNQCAIRVDGNQTALLFEECITYFDSGDPEARPALSQLFPRLGRHITDITTVLKLRCVLPFWYKGEQYTECTYKDSNRPWCATHIDDNGVMAERDFCPPNWDIPEVNILDRITSEKKESQNVTSVRGKPCLFPFLHKDGFSYGCVEDGYQRPWCATKVDQNRKVLESDHCPDNWDSLLCPATPTENIRRPLQSNLPQLATETGKSCMLPFVYLGKTHVACTVEDSVQAWCPTAVETHGTPVEWDYCAQGWEKEAEKSSRLHGDQKTESQAIYQENPATTSTYSVCEYKRIARDASTQLRSAED